MATSTQREGPAWLSQTNVLWIPAITGLLYLITLAYQRGYQDAAGFSLRSLTHEAVGNAAQNVVLPAAGAAAFSVMLGILVRRRLARGSEFVADRTNWLRPAMGVFPIVTAAIFFFLWCGWWMLSLLDWSIIGASLVVYYICFLGRSDIGIRQIVQAVALSVVLIQLAQILGKMSLLRPAPFEDCSWAGPPFVVVERTGDLEACAAFVIPNARSTPSYRRDLMQLDKSVFACVEFRRIGQESAASRIPWDNPQNSCLIRHKIQGG
jgi:hypothetical protein